MRIQGVCLCVLHMWPLADVPQCLSGGCINGVCSWSPCVGMDANTACGSSPTCRCLTSVDGMGFCTEPAAATAAGCTGLKSCSVDGDCPPGSICGVSAQCGGNVCLPGAGSCGSSVTG